MSELWQPDYLEEYKRRISIIDKAKTDPLLCSALKTYYAAHSIDFIQDWCITVDPRAVKPQPRVMPFLLFQRQKEFIRFMQECLSDKQHGLVEKCRDMGATWCAVSFAIWLWRFHPASIIGFGSRKEEYVDHRGDPKAIFPKLRETLEYLPDFLMPAGFEMNKHATYMRIINPENESAIIGEAGSSQGRGGRSTMFFMDEAAHYEQDQEIEAAVGDNSDVIIAISSVNGTNNVFYRKRMAGEIWMPDAPPIMGKTRVFIFDWRDNPFKSQEWYDTRRARAEAEGLLHIFAQEVERNYSAAIERIIIPPEWCEAAIDSHKKISFGVGGQKVAGQDIADGGGDKNALVIRQGNIVRYAECWGGEAAEAAKISVPLCVEYGVRTLMFDSIGVGAGYKAQINTMKEKVDDKGQSTFPRHLLVMPWNAGSSPLDPEDNIIPGDMQSPTNEEQYGNLKAQAWFRLRARFAKTFRAIRYGEKYEAEELISIDSSIPRLHQLKNELSQAQYKSGTNGKTIVDKRPDGSSSPNLADALVMSFCPVTSVSIFDVL